MCLRLRMLQIAAIVLPGCLAIPRAGATDFMYGCRSRPACGKICKLVTENKKLSVFCYGCECADICIPGPSRPGCKHCASCCGKDESCADCGSAAGCDCGHRVTCKPCQSEPPKCEFCWRDWCACGCAKPRTVKVLTKYQAEKEICWYHWEVVEASACECEAAHPAIDESPSRCSSCYGDAKRGGCQCLYKAAPPDAALGDVLPLSREEEVEVASYITEGERAIRFADSPHTERIVANEPAIKPQAEPIPSPQYTEETSWIERLGRLFRK